MSTPNDPIGSSDSGPSVASPHAATLLKIGAVLFALVGGGIAAWTTRQWIVHPDIRATQFDFSAPLWPAVTLFVVGATVAGVALLWRARKRVDAGEDLFANRHRRRPNASGD